jgi:hypothetical protein
MNEMPTTPQECIGLTARYRKPFEKKATHSQIKGLRSFINLAGDRMDIFQMANGDEIGAGACYFDIINP